MTVIEKCATWAGASDLRAQLEGLTQDELRELQPLLEEPRRLLAAMLRVAVPARRKEVATLGPAEFRARAAACADVVAHRGDVLMRGAKKSLRAEMFDAMADGLAMLSLTPSGPDAVNLYLDDFARGL